MLRLGAADGAGRSHGREDCSARPAAGARPNRRRRAIRHGVKNDSRITRPEIFEAPTRRSTKMIGTSPTVASGLQRQEQGLDLERVAVRHDAVERQAGDRLAAPAAEAGGAVAHLHPGDRPHVPVGEGAEDQPAQRPVHHADALQVARADDDVVAPRGGDQLRHVARVVRQVGVHLQDELGVGGQRRPHAVEIRPPQPPLAGAVEHRQPARRSARRAGRPGRRCRRAIRRRSPAPADRHRPAASRRRPADCPARCRSGAAPARSAGWGAAGQPWATSRSMTASQVMAAARSRPAAPSAAASARRPCSR